MKLNLIVSLVLTLFSAALVDADDVNQSVVDKYYSGWSKGDGTSDQMVNLQFSQGVAVKDQPAILSELIDRSDKNPGDRRVFYNVMMFLYGREPGYVWGDRLEKAIAAHASSRDFGCRLLALDLLAAKKPQQYRAICVAGLTDPEPRVRKVMISAILRWPDGRVILENYVQQHSGDPTYAEAIHIAQRCLNPPPLPQAK